MDPLEVRMFRHVSEEIVAGYVGNNNSNHNEIVAAHLGELKYVCISRNMITYTQTVIAGHIK